MKKIFTLIALMTCGIAAMAQGLAASLFQAELRDASGELIANTTVGFKYKISCIGADNAIIEREGTAQTDANGVVLIRLGMDGTATANNKVANFGEFPFDKVAHNFKIPMTMEIDPKGGTDYTISGTTQIGYAVPYAVYANKSEDFQTSAAAKLTEDELNVIKSMAVTPITVSMENLNVAPGGWVEINGQRIDAEHPTVELNVPAYAPVYMSWNTKAGKGVEDIKLNGVIVDKYSGSYYTPATKKVKKEIFMILPASDWAKVSTRVAYNGDYNYTLKSADDLYALRNNSGIQTLSESEYVKLYPDTKLYTAGTNIHFTQPAGTRFTASNSYIHLFFEVTLDEEYDKEVKIEKSEFKNGKNFLVGPFDPTKKNTIEVIYKYITF
ncbi:MAG: Ig-like domain-containing protein [Bacteroidales bacterium]|nr:Ig-like domain-containing protein [Bacteroidales bacterium]